MTRASRPIAVLTGDIVNSTGLGVDKTDRALAALEHCARGQRGWIGADLRFTRQRGDGWQVALERPEFALRSALIFRAALRALGAEYDSYIGMAQGAASTAADADLNRKMDAVFIASGRALDTLKAMQSFQPHMAHAARGALAAAVALADHLSDGWTPAQAQAIGPMLSPETDLSYTELAEILGKSRQAVTKSLFAAGFQPLFLALQLLEKAPQHD